MAGQLVPEKQTSGALTMVVLGVLLMGPRGGYCTLHWSSLFREVLKGLDLVAHAFYRSSLEAEAGGSLNLRPAISRSAKVAE